LVASCLYGRGQYDLIRLWPVPKIGNVVIGLGLKFLSTVTYFNNDDIHILNNDDVHILYVVTIVLVGSYL